MEPSSTPPPLPPSPSPAAPVPPATTAPDHVPPPAPAKQPEPNPFEGNYKLIKSENGQHYLKKIGVGLLARKIGDPNKAIIDLKYNKATDTYYAKISIGSRSKELRFKIGVIFDEDTIDGRHCKTVFTRKNSHILIQEQRWKGKLSIITYEFKGDKVFATLKADDVTATQVYQKLNKLTG
ncbi:unnamed protein product [Allacma fusca]|uniref:Uncharacterized protein n=1 Tax=Allacma fusca TaxID=39272 RepID=A0A8J2PNP6_9HEXA|nr:unnamed protein product [Allacma fusca]